VFRRSAVRALDVDDYHPDVQTDLRRQLSLFASPASPEGSRLSRVRARILVVTLHCLSDAFAPSRAHRLTPAQSREETHY
jgi:hypothetical protein